MNPGAAVRGDLGEALRGLTCPLRFGERLAPYTSFRIGGPAGALALPRGEEDLLPLFARCREEGLPLSLLGGGANLLVSDRGVRGVVVSFAEGFREVERVKWPPSEGSPSEPSEAPEGVLLRAGAGVKMPHLVALAAREGLAGLGCAAGVPGTVGGAVIMNAGSAESYLGQVLHSVRWVALPPAATEPRELGRGELRFTYRATLFPAPGAVLAASFLLRRGDRKALQRALREDSARRRRTQPQGLPCAGSIFKNPPGGRAGVLIDRAGLKGLAVGRAAVSETHANFIVNRGGASAGEVLELIAQIRRRVEEHSGVRLELELRTLGEFEEGALP
ncbi:MAG: UDP-N-acetylmuramate dehydrogenase [Nitrospinota bacterium]